MALGFSFNALICFAASGFRVFRSRVLGAREGHFPVHITSHPYTPPYAFTPF